MSEVRVTARGAERWVRGHPWIYRSDVRDRPAAPGLVRVRDPRGRFIGQALYSPRSEIRLRLLERTDRPVDGGWWRERLAAALARRAGIDATAYRVVHAEGDGLPSLILDRYDRWVVGQILSAGLETLRGDLVPAVLDVLGPEGLLFRNEGPARRREGLAEETVLAHGAVPEEVEVREGPVRYLAAPWTGQKTGAYLDQRPNRLLAAELVPPGGSALDCFTYHGSFALHLARRADSVVALDVSADALARAAENCARNNITNVSLVEADTFDYLRDRQTAGERFDTIVLDPPAFAKNKPSLPAAIRGYKDINLRAMRILAPGGLLFTASCSFHLTKPLFLEMLHDAAADSGRRIAIRTITGQPLDHPEVLTIPETGYLKGALLEALD